jgi:hypothetical protein
VRGKAASTGCQHARAINDPAVKVVLAAATLPRSWASMYLIYEAIAENVGGKQALDKRGFVSERDLRDFRHAANNSRSLDEGIDADEPNVFSIRQRIVPANVVKRQ